MKISVMYWIFYHVKHFFRLVYTNYVLNIKRPQCRLQTFNFWPIWLELVDRLANFKLYYVHLCFFSKDNIKNTDIIFKRKIESHFLSLFFKGLLYTKLILIYLIKVFTLNRFIFIKTKITILPLYIDNEFGWLFYWYHVIKVPNKSVQSS